MLVNSNYNCFICNKHKGSSNGEIFKDHVIAVYHRAPTDSKVYLGYLFIEVRRHIKGLEDMSDEESIAVSHMLQKLSKVLKDNYEIEHVYSHVIGDRIPHLHIHIIPRYKGTPKEYWGLKTLEWENAPHGDDKEVKEFCNKFKKLLVYSHPEIHPKP